MPERAISLHNHIDLIDFSQPLPDTHYCNTKSAPIVSHARIFYRYAPITDNQRAVWQT